MTPKDAPPVPHDWSGRLEDFRRSPREVILSEPFPAPLALRHLVRCSVLEAPAAARGAAAAAGWDDVAQAGLAHTVLAPSEHATWLTVGGPKRRSEWLLGRIAAKDVVRMHLRETRGLRLSAADIVIGADAAGRPVADGEALVPIGISLAVSLSHTDGVAMALVTEPEAGAGIDVERLSRRRGDYAEAAFTPAERARLDAAAAGGAPGTLHERSLRLWCAKESVAKALGRGLLGNPMNLEAGTIDAAWSRIDLVVAGSLARALPERVGRPVTAHISVEGDLVVAAALAGPSR